MGILGRVVHLLFLHLPYPIVSLHSLLRLSTSNHSLLSYLKVRDNRRRQKRDIHSIDESSNVDEEEEELSPIPPFLPANTVTSELSIRDTVVNRLL